MISIWLAILAFIAGVLFLFKGSDILVEGTSKTAAQLGVSTLIISLILVAFGTSSPEFTISVGASIQGIAENAQKQIYADIAMGNIIGSCIANILLILGISSVIRPLSVQKSIIKREMPILFVVTIIFLVFASFELLDSFHFFGGLLFLVFFVVFIIYFYRCAKKEMVKENDVIMGGTLRKNILLIFVGIIGVLIGAWLLIESSIAIASYFHISEMIIALSMVAVGTSLPELVVSALASYKKQADIAVGNVIGSNIFNILFVIGTCALFIPLYGFLSINNLILLSIVTIILMPIIYTGHIISRGEGVFLLVLYVGYIWYIFFYL